VEARALASKLELAWDGEWYRRGYYDDGTPLGSAQNDECQIDSIAQSWAVLSGAVPQRFAERAMDAVRSSLIARRSQILLLLNPPSAGWMYRAGLEVSSGCGAAARRLSLIHAFRRRGPSTRSSGGSSIHATRLRCRIVTGDVEA
jgi:hypothetical protein